MFFIQIPDSFDASPTQQIAVSHHSLSYYCTPDQPSFHVYLYKVLFSCLPAFLPTSIPTNMLYTYSQTSTPHHDTTLQLRQALAHPLLEQALPVRVPAAQRRAALREVARAPQDAQPVDLRPRLAVRAQDVERARAHLVEHVQYGLRRGPCAGRRRGRSGREPGCGDGGMCPTGSIGLCNSLACNARLQKE